MTAKNEISDVLKKLRKQSGQSVNDAVNALMTGYNIKISAKTLYGYESGLSMPNADVFVALCKIYDCENPLFISDSSKMLTSKREIDHMHKYRIIDNHGKDLVDVILDKEYERCIDDTTTKNASHNSA